MKGVLFDVFNSNFVMKLTNTSCFHQHKSVRHTKIFKIVLFYFYFWQFLVCQYIFCYSKIILIVCGFIINNSTWNSFDFSNMFMSKIDNRGKLLFLPFILSFFSALFLLSFHPFILSLCISYSIFIHMCI